MLRDRVAFRCWAVPVSLVLWLGWNLHYEWSLNPQYNFGWAVPILAALLFWQRWQTRPTRSVPTETIGHRIFNALLLFLLLPVRLVEEANPDWRLLSWALALIVVAYALLALKDAGGRRWARHFAFPVCFLLVAVPWPVRFENFIVQELTRAVASAAVEIGGWIGIGAYQLGNVIQLRNGFVGVDEACSGVRTLQSAIMVTLFLGELLRLSVRRRILFFIIGCAWVFACNIVRATTLVIIAATRGLDVLARWHDFIGSAVLAAGMAGLLAAAWKLGGGASPARRDDKDEEGSAITRGIVPAFAAVAWLVFVFLATELWYRAHERRLIERPGWSVAWPHDSTRLPIADSTRSILRFNAAASASWQDGDSVRWWGFFAQWQPGRTALQLVRSHSPDICLPAIGRSFLRELPPMEVVSGAAHLPLRVYEFEQEGKPLFVFVCIQEDKIAPAQNSRAGAEWNARGRLRAAWNGQRNLGQRLFELAVTGFENSDAARAGVSLAARELLRPASPVTTD